MDDIIILEDYICSYCKREIPNIAWRTTNGCYWCDSKYWSKKKEEEKKGKK